MPTPALAGILPDASRLFSTKKNGLTQQLPDPSRRAAENQFTLDRQTDHRKSWSVIPEFPLILVCEHNKPCNSVQATQGLQRWWGDRSIPPTGLFTLKKRRLRGDLWNTLRVGVRRMGPDSFQWCLVTGQGATGTNWSMGSSVWTWGRTSSLWGWQSTGTGCLGRLWSLLLWRYSRPAWTRSCVACCRWPCFCRGVGLDDPQRSLPTPNILWLCDYLESWFWLYTSLRHPRSISITRETHSNVLHSKGFVIILSLNNWQKSKQTGAKPLKFRPHSAIAQSKCFKVFYATKLLWRLWKVRD